MTYENPYQAPQTETLHQDPYAPAEDLAGRGQRFVAALLDGLIALAYSIPLMFAMGIWEILMRGEQPSVQLMLANSVVAVVLFIVFHGYLLHSNGQTIGKWLMGIRISDLENNVPSLSTIIGLRYLPIWVVSLIPILGNILVLVDVLFIFRGDRRCIHDLIAGTKVIPA